MDLHFRAFSFVDRITDVQPGERICGRYTIPPALDVFPVSLVGEAVGQLAAWAAMAAVDYTHRPLAGIAGEVELLAEVRPGQVLELATELQSVDTDTTAYSGSATADGVEVIRLHDCVGPMMPANRFDDPQKLRERFALLTAEGVEPGGFAGVPAIDLQPNGGEHGQVTRTMLRVPTEAPFFADHFPRRSVFPGTLLMQACLQTAARLAGEVPNTEGAIWSPNRVSDVKLRSFIFPGQNLQLEAKRAELSGPALGVAVETRLGQRLVGSVQIQFGTKERP